MKKVSKKELEAIAKKYDADLEYDPLATLFFIDSDGEECCFEATEQDGDNYYGFKFCGNQSKAQEFIKVWNELTQKKIEKQLLTIELAKLLTGKKVRTSYCDTNEGEETFLIVRMFEEASQMIGQKKNQRLVTKELDEKNNPKEEERTWFYEWQGIFRRGSGAERLFVEEIL